MALLVQYPSAASNGTFFYYSANQGPVHGIFLSPYIDYTIGSAQWEWLYNDLRSIDRAVTPWCALRHAEKLWHSRPMGLATLRPEALG